MDEGHSSSHQEERGHRSEQDSDAQLLELAGDERIVGSDRHVQQQFLLRRWRRFWLAIWVGGSASFAASQTFTCSTWVAAALLTRRQIMLWLAQQ